nr:TonB-dependent receptor [Solimonas terrae]
MNPAEAPSAAGPQTAEAVQSTAPSADDAQVVPTIAVPQQPAPVPATEQTASSPQIAEVIVTATKRSENVRDIPASIAVLSGEDLERRGAQDTADIVKLVPGANVTSTGDSPQRVTLRGISSDIGTSSTTGILFGNVSFTEAWAPVVSLDPNPFDMGSVEVLKGPQGTLFGASALNGAVRYVPTPPKFGEYELKWFGQYTSIHEGDAGPSYGAAVNLPFGDTLALRVMAFDRDSPGYIDNLRTGKKDVNRTDQKGARALLGWRPGDAWDILLTTAWQETDLRDVGIADNDQGRLETNDRPRASPNHTQYSMADLAVTWNGDWAQFVSDTSYIDKGGHNFFDASSRITGNGALSLTAQYYAGDSSTVGQEFRLVSVDDPQKRWKWVTGIFGWQQDVKNTLSVPLAVDVTPLATIIDALNLGPLSSLFNGSGSPVVLQTVGDVRIRELAAFGELTRRLGDSVELSLGGRLYRTQSGGQNAQSGVYVLAQQGSSPYVIDGEVKQQGFNPKASIVWHLNDDILTYGLVSKGFRVGGIQTGLTSSFGRSAAPETFKSDTLWNYEAGIRTQFLHNTLRLDLTGFLVDWKNPQSLQPDASGLSVYIDNVGGVRSKGADLSLQYLFPWAGLRLTNSVSYADTVTTKPFTTAAGDIYPSGTNWPLAPKWQTASTLSFLQPAGDWLLGGYATYTTIGKTVPTFGAHKIFGYHQLDLQFSVANARIEWLPEIALIVNNLTDERGITNAFTSGVPSPALAAEEYYYITPRAIGIRLMGRFGD